MTVGLHTTNLVNVILNLIRGTNATAPTATYVKLHTGDPGSAGTSNASANTTRVVITHAAPSGGAIAITGTAPSWASWASGSETLSHVSYWDASTAGNVLWSAALSSSKAMTNGDTFTLSTSGLAFTPLMA